MKSKLAVFLFALAASLSFTAFAESPSECEARCYRILDNCHAPGAPYGGICVTSFNQCMTYCHQ